MHIDSEDAHSQYNQNYQQNIQSNYNPSNQFYQQMRSSPNNVEIDTMSSKPGNYMQSPQSKNENLPGMSQYNPASQLNMPQTNKVSVFCCCKD